jgi:hypothetical protein
MSEIVYVGGPRDGEHDEGEFVEGQQILTIATGDVDDAVYVDGVAELAWHVYRANHMEEGWRADYLGLFGAHELPRS